MNKYELMWVAMKIDAQRDVEKEKEINFEDPDFYEVSKNASRSKMILERMEEIEQEVEKWKK